MKVFAMVMLRFALIMHLSSFLQSGTLATLGEWETSCQKLKEWETLCHLWVNVISISLGSITSDDLSNIPNINHSLDVLLYEVNKFPLEGMDELLDRRLREPLKVAISNCNKLLNEVEHSGREDNQKYLETLVSKTSSIAKGIGTEFNTFIFEVQLELIKKVKWTFGNKKELTNKFSNLCASAQQIESYCNPESFSRAFLWVSGMGGPPCQPGTPEFVEYLGILILNAKLGILKRELHVKIAGFVEQQHFDWNGFMTFSHNFKREWNQIEQQIDQVNNRDLASTMRVYRKELNDLAQNAMKETAPLKGIITKMLDQLTTKCHDAKLDGPMVAMKEKRALKDRIRRWLNRLLKKCKLRNKKEISNLNSAESQHQQLTDAFLNEQTQIETKKEEINAKKEIINDIGMFDGEAYKLLVRFEHEELGSNDFCTELETAVEQDKKMVLQAYQVKSPGAGDEQSYINRKGFYSVNMQAIVDSKCQFMNVDVSWPGATHDSFVLRQSSTWEFFESGQGGNSILLGDSGYPLKTWLITPFLSPVTESQKRFNYALSRGLTCVERAFGILKRRFSANHSGYRLPIKNVANAILTSVVLHNLALQLRLPLYGEDFNEEQPPPFDFAEIAEEPQWRNERLARQAALEKRMEIFTI